MPQLKQDGPATIFYVLFDGSKGHTACHGHEINAPFDFLLATEDRAEWEAWHQCEHFGCDLCPEDCPECEENA